MRAIWISLPIALWVGVAYVGAADLSGDQIIAKSQEAYATVKSYVGTTNVRSKAVINDMQLDQMAVATIVFVRPGNIWIEGKDTSGRTFKIVSDGKDAWSSWELKNSGTFEKVQNVENAIAANTGIAAAAPTVVPAALLKLKWGYPFGRARNSKLEGRDKIGGSECYKVVSESRQGRTTYWVDSESFLLRQMKEEQDESQLQEIQKRTQEHMDKALKDKGMEFPKLVMKSREVLHAFSIEKIDATVDPKLFQDPTRTK